MDIKNIAYKVIFFLGWVLSPLTFWNDVFVNLPLSYLIANIVVRFFPLDFLVTVLVSYWLTNALGVVMMVFSGNKVFSGAGKTGGRIFLEIVGTVAVYSLVLIVLQHYGILRPIRW